MSEVIATYVLEGQQPLERAAEILAGEQSTGTFVRVARESDEILEQYAARLVSFKSIPPSGLTPLHGFSGDPSKLERAEVKLSFPLDNFGPSIPNLLAAVAGNLFEIKELAGVRLVDLDLPDEFGDQYLGPGFGISGTRELMSRKSGVLIGTIIKPSIGLTIDQLTALVTELVDAGIDFIKDDELQGNGPKSPLEARIRAVMPVLDGYADRTGRKPMYAFNITDDLATMRKNHDLVLEAGGTCVMACVNLIGLAGLEELRSYSQLPIHAHRTMFGSFGRSEQIGIAFKAWQKLARLCGADHLHTNGISNKFYETDAEVLKAINDVRTPLLGLTPTVPVLSSGQWAGLAHDTYAATGTTDMLVLAGGGIHGHPLGSAAGVASMRDAWAAAERGISLKEAVGHSVALREAVAAFG